MNQKAVSTRPLFLIMSAGMRVALITDGIWPYVLGGMQKHSYYLCKYLAGKKIHVDLFHFNRSGYDISRLEFFSEEEKRYITPFLVDFPKSLPFPGHYRTDQRPAQQLRPDLHQRIHRLVPDTAETPEKDLLCPHRRKVSRVRDVPETTKP
jgi:hypothetical protein